MPKIDFSTVEDAKTFVPIPAGEYVVEINSIEETTTSHGDELWKLRLKIHEGPHAGRYVFDNLVFSPKAMKRVKLLCSRLGLDITGEVDLTPRMLRGKQCRVTVDVEDFIDDEGRERKRNNIGFAAYEALGDGGSDERQPGDDDEDDPL